MSLDRRLARLEARYPPPEPLPPCPQQVAWLESLPEPERAAAATAILLPAAHPARDQWAAAWRDWLAAVAQAEQDEDATRAHNLHAWHRDPGTPTAIHRPGPVPPLATIYADVRAFRRTCWPKYFGCEAETCACWQWVQAQPDAPPSGAAPDLHPAG
jgi:hypothetical protein